MEKIGLEAVFKTEAFRQGMQVYKNGLQSAEGETQSAAKVLGGALAVGAGIAMAALAALTIVIAGTVFGLSKLVFGAADFGEKIAAMSEVTGISIERLQELTYAGTLLDVNIETITSGLRFLTRNMYTAREGTGEQAEAFKYLGINILETNGELRDSDTVFGEVLDALGKLKNPTQVDAIAMKLMGRSAMELNPLIKAGSRVIADYSQRAHEMGAVLSDEAILSLDKFKDEMDAMKLTGQALKAELGSALLPVFQAILDLIGRIVSGEKFQTWFKNLSDSILATTSHLATFLSQLFGIDLTDLPEVPAPAKAPVYPEGTQYITSGNKEFDQAMRDYWNGRGPDPRLATTTAPPPGAGRTLRDEEVAPRFEPTEFELAIGKFVEGIKNIDWKTLFDRLQGLGEAIAKVDWIKFAEDILAAVTLLAEILANPQKKGDELTMGMINKVKELGGTIKGGINTGSQMFGDMLTGGLEKGEQSVTGLADDFSKLIQDLLYKVFGIGGTSGTPKAQMQKSGTDMVAGLSQGYADEWSIFEGKAKTAAQKLLDDVNGIFGVSSPSKEFYKTGVNLVRGLEEGIMRSLMKLAPSIPLVFSTGEAGKTTKNTTYNVTINNPTMQNTTTSINQTLKNLNWLSST